MNDTGILKLLFKLSPPVMLSLLIQSVYNIVDSYFVAQNSPEGLTALSIIFPVQLLITAVATGTGTGINILIATMDGAGSNKSQGNVLISGIFLALVHFLLFALIGNLCIPGYYHMSSDQPLVWECGIEYGRIILLFSFGTMAEAVFSKFLQAKGNMVVPMLAQIAGALINVVLDPILIFGAFGIPAMGVKGAAAATVVGQWASMGIVGAYVLRRFSPRGRLSWRECIRIYRAGLPSVVMQSLYTVYIVGLNLILKGFTEDAVTVLGIYYKLQTFFFIPLMGLQQVILPIVSFFNGAGNKKQVRQVTVSALVIACAVMLLAAAVFLAVPDLLLSVFSADPMIHRIGKTALRIIAISFLPAAAVMMLTTYFQGIGRGGASLLITLLRQVVLLVPLAWVLHFGGLNWVWATFPLTELASVICSVVLLRKGAKGGGAFHDSPQEKEILSGS